MEGKEILLQLSLIYGFAKIGGAISQKLRQPVVLGEMLAGIIIGPSVLNLFSMNETLSVFSDLGVIMLMFIAGLETDMNELKSSSKASSVIALGGVFVPFVLAYMVCKLFGMQEFSQAAFIGLIFTATSVSITVQTLRELKQLRSKQGVGILGAAVIDDVVGIIMLALLLGMVTGTGNILLTVQHLLVYFTAVAVGGFIFHKVINRYGYTLNLSKSITLIGLIMCLVLAYYAEKAEVAAITGAYLAGLILSSTSYRTKIASNLEGVAYLVFTPIFFVGIGMNTELNNMGNMLVFALVMLIVAIVGKIFGCGAMAKVMGYSTKQSLQVGIGMVARGEVALIIANIGLSQGIIQSEMFTAIIFVIVLTTLITPSLLKWSFKGEKPVDDMVNEINTYEKEEEVLADIVNA